MALSARHKVEFSQLAEVVRKEAELKDRDLLDLVCKAQALEVKDKLLAVKHLVELKEAVVRDKFLVTRL